VGLLGLSACKASDTPRQPDIPTTAEHVAGTTDDATVCIPPVAVSTGYMGSEAWPSPACRQRAAAVLTELSLEAKVAQMMQPDIDQVTDLAQIERSGFGAMLAGGNSGPKDRLPESWAHAIDALHHAAARAPHRIPMLYGIDAVHGHNNVKGAVIFPHNIGLGATRDPELVERIARVTAEDVRATGMNWMFAPVLAAAQDERWGRTYESFGESPELVQELGLAFIRGVQGPGVGQAETSILACAKHFLGDGNTSGGVDRGDTRMTDEAVRTELVEAYRGAIAAGVGSVMVSFSSLRGTKMHCNGPWVTDVLKRELGFNGFVVSDWEAVEQIPGDYEQRLAQSINAGIDMVMHPAAYQQFIPTLMSLVPEAIPVARIDDAVTRILAVKCEMGLLPASGTTPRPTMAQRDKLTLLRASQRLTLAREAVGKSMVLLKNDGVLPLRKGKIHVAGKNADNLGHQCGGWSIQWQGGSGPITEGTTLLAGIREVAGSGSQVTFSKDGSGAKGAAVAIAIVGEAPYAESEGDRQDLALDAVDQATIARLAEADVPIVLVVVSGRPLILGDVVDKVDAIVAAWLPGTEGAGVADVLFGVQPPTGKLSVTWPKSMDQIPIRDSEGTQALFPFGFGLTY